MKNYLFFSFLLVLFFMTSAKSATSRDAQITTNKTTKSAGQKLNFYDQHY